MSVSLSVSLSVSESVPVSMSVPVCLCLCLCDAEIQSSSSSSSSTNTRSATAKRTNAHVASLLRAVQASALTNPLCCSSAAISAAATSAEHTRTLDTTGASHSNSTDPGSWPPVESLPLFVVVRKRSANCLTAQS